VNWAIARTQGWRIVLRIEDLDTPRVKAGVTELTIDLLTWLGIDWDFGPIIQSGDHAHHRAAIEALAAQRRVYPCARSRTQIEAAASAPQEGGHEARYPAQLRPSTIPHRFTDDQPSWRFVVPDGTVSFVDTFAGPQNVDVATDIGDFIVWTRRDPLRPGQASYQLAVVVDDARQGVTHIVRGDDLLTSAARQRLIADALGCTPPVTYAHLPLVRGSDGRRLAKRHGDTRLDVYRAAGIPRDRVVGLIAFWCGLPGPRRAWSPAEFRAALTLDRIPRTPVTFTPEDDAWLRHST